MGCAGRGRQGVLTLPFFPSLVLYVILSLHLRPKSFTMKKFITKPILSLLVLPAILFAFTTLPDHANLSGDWKLNENKSELGDFGARFAARSIKIEQKDDAITI